MGSHTLRGPSDSTGSILQQHKSEACTHSLDGVNDGLELVLAHFP